MNVNKGTSMFIFEYNCSELHTFTSLTLKILMSAKLIRRGTKFCYIIANERKSFIFAAFLELDFQWGRLRELIAIPNTFNVLKDIMSFKQCLIFYLPSVTILALI